MAQTRLKPVPAVPAADFRVNVALLGVINGVNATFFTPENFRQSPDNFAIVVLYNGVRLILTDDYSVAESGGAGTGFDTVTLLFAPKSGDKLTADYVVE